jgi:type I pantothenate kinase
MPEPDASLPDGVASGFETFSRREWAALARPWPGPSSRELADEVVTSELMAPDEIVEVYLPLSQLLDRLVTSGRTSARAFDEFVSGEARAAPFVIGIAGGVAVGKSTVARILQALLRRAPDRPTVELLGTDAFLFPNDVLAERGLMERKGFPETYDHAALLETLSAIRAGAPEVAVPVYSHEAYDVVSGTGRTISRPDVVIVEGLNVLQVGPAPPGGQAVVSDFIDVALYLDSAEEDAAGWHEERLLEMRSTAGKDRGAFLDWFSSLSEEEARNVANVAWSEINLVNMRQHVAPTRARAHLILRKDGHHRVRQVQVRRP